MKNKAVRTNVVDYGHMSREECLMPGAKGEQTEQGMVDYGHMGIEECLPKR